MRDPGNEVVKQERKKGADEQIQKQRKVRIRMMFTLYFLGVKESHFVYRPIKVLFR